MLGPWIFGLSPSPPTSRARGRGRGALTQVSLVEPAGAHITQLYRSEAGTAEPTLGTLRRQAVALSVSAEALGFGDQERLSADEALRLAFEATTLLDEAEQAHVRALPGAFHACYEAARDNEGARKPGLRGH
jgi:hypothetical protein